MIQQLVRGIPRPEEGMVLNAVLPQLFTPIIVVHVEPHHVLEILSLEGKEHGNNSVKQIWGKKVYSRVIPNMCYFISISKTCHSDA